MRWAIRTRFKIIVCIAILDVINGKYNILEVSPNLVCISKDGPIN